MRRTLVSLRSSPVSEDHESGSHQPAVDPYGLLADSPRVWRPWAFNRRTVRNARDRPVTVDEKVKHTTPVVLAAFAARALRELLLRLEKLLILRHSTTGAGAGRPCYSNVVPMDHAL